MEHFHTFKNISGGRIFGRFELRIERFYASRDYIGTKLRHYPRHAPQQAFEPQTRRLHHDRRLDLCVINGLNAPNRGVGLPKIRRLPTLRNGQSFGLGLRHFPHVDQWSRFFNLDGMLPQNVLRYSWLPSLEFQ